MATFKKTILQVGKRYRSPDREVIVTKDRLKHWADTFQAMSAAGAVVPISWDHNADASKLVPLSSEEYERQRSAKNTVGRLAGVKVSDAGDSAELTVEITDPTAQGRAERNEVYVSPVIFDHWKHGSGQEFSDCFTHVDLVNHPVDHSQSPFSKVEPGMIACALRLGADVKVCRLANDDDENPFAKKDGDGDGKTGEAEGEASAEAPPNAEEPAKNPDMPPAKATDKSKLEASRAGLSQMGLVLPSDFDFANDGAIDILLASINTYLAAQNKAEADAAEDDSEESGSQGDITVADPGYAAMSLYAENMHRDTIKAKLDSLLASGRCKPKEHEAQLAALGAIKLSLDASGKQLSKSDVETFIAHRESVPQGTFWDDQTRTRMSAQVAEPPANMRSDLTTDEIQNTANWALGRKPAAAGK